MDTRHVTATVWEELHSYARFLLYIQYAFSSTFISIASLSFHIAVHRGSRFDPLVSHLCFGSSCQLAVHTCSLPEAW